MAAMCFEKAGDINWEKRAKASSLRATADRLRSSNAIESCIILREAAEIFDSIGRAESAAECFCDLGEYERAGIMKFSAVYSCTEIRFWIVTLIILLQEIFIWRNIEKSKMD